MVRLIFKVAKNALSPFHVRVEGGDITVLGTSFNVSAYKEDVTWRRRWLKDGCKWQMPKDK